MTKRNAAHIAKGIWKEIKNRNMIGWFKIPEIDSLLYGNKEKERPIGLWTLKNSKHEVIETTIFIR